MNSVTEYSSQVTQARRHAPPRQAIEAVNTSSNPQDLRSEHSFLLFGRGMHVEEGWNAAGSLNGVLGWSLRLDVKSAGWMTDTLRLRPHQ